MIPYQKIANLSFPQKEGFLTVSGQDLQPLAQKAFIDLRLYFRKSHLQHWHHILHAKDASDGEKKRMLRNIKAACIAADQGVPYCQDTGTDTVYIQRSNTIFEPKTNLFNSFSAGALQARTQNPFRSSIFAPNNEKTYSESNTGDNSPLELHFLPETTPEPQLLGLFVCKGGGSGSKLWNFSMPPLLAGDEDRLYAFLKEKIAALGHAACPPYHLSIVLGGLSHLQNSQILTRMTIDDETVYAMPKVQRAPFLEEKITKSLKNSTMGAQGSGKYFVMPDGVRVLRAPRHAAHFFVGIGVSCSAHRIQAFKIDKNGVFLEELEKNPHQFLPKETKNVKKRTITEKTQHIDLKNDENAVEKLKNMKAGQRFLLSGNILGGRDKAHTRWMLNFEKNAEIPAYLKENIAIMYVGPADTPKGSIIGSFGPTTASRMDVFASFLGENGIIPLSIGKGSRSKAFSEACKTHNMMYAAVQGGPAAFLRQFVKQVDILDFEDLGMEAVRLYKIHKMPVQMVVSTKGEDIYAEMAEDFIKS